MPRAARAFDFVVAAGFAASGCLVGVKVVVAAGSFASIQVVWGRWAVQLEHGGGLDHGAEDVLGLAVLKNKPKAFRGCFGCYRQLLCRRWILLLPRHLRLISTLKGYIQA